MNDQDFMMDVVQRLARIETLLGNIPVCRYREVDDRINLNRRIIFLLLAGMLTLSGLKLFGG